MKHLVKLLLLPLGMIALALFVSCSLFDTSTAIEADGDVISDSLLIDDVNGIDSDELRFDISIKPDDIGEIELEVLIVLGRNLKHLNFSDTKVAFSAVGKTIVVDTLYRHSSRRYSRTVREPFNYLDGAICGISISGTEIGLVSKVVEMPHRPTLHSATEMVKNGEDALKVTFKSNNPVGTMHNIRAYSEFKSSSMYARDITADYHRSAVDTSVVLKSSKVYGEPGFQYVGYLIRSIAYRSVSLPSISEDAHITFYSSYSNDLRGF